MYYTGRTLDVQDTLRFVLRSRTTPAVVGVTAYDISVETKNEAKEILEALSRVSPVNGLSFSWSYHEYNVRRVDGDDDPAGFFLGYIEPGAVTIVMRYEKEVNDDG